MTIPKQFRVPGFLAAILTLLLAVSLPAHGGAEHITGVVKTVAADGLTVETLKHETISVTLTPKTESYRSGTKASVKDLKVGDRVVIHAVKGKAGAYEASEVQWGPVASSARK